MAPVGALISFLVFVMYCVFRTQSGDAGFDARFMWMGTACAIFPLAVIPAVVFMFTIREYDENATACVQCGYDLRGLREPLCPECGDPTDNPRFRPTKSNRPVIVVSILVAITTLAMPIAGETYLYIEERVFVGEAQTRLKAGITGPYVRKRWWPCGDSALVYDAAIVINTG